MPTATPTATMIRFMLPSYFTLPRVRMPAAATDPNSTMPAPPRTGGGITATTPPTTGRDRKSTRLNSSHVAISYAVFCLKKKKEHAELLDETLGAALLTMERKSFANDGTEVEYGYHVSSASRYSFQVTFVNSEAGANSGP